MMNRLRLSVFACGFALFVCDLARADNKAALAAQTKFVDVVFKRFELWDLNHDGVLASAELDKFVIDPKVRGEAAAALGAIKVFERSKKWELPPLTRQYFKDYLQKQTKSPQKDLPDFGKRYSAGLKKIKSAERELFKEGPPTLENLHQGKLGDCFFLAPLGAAIHRNKLGVQKMFKVYEDGSVEVAFPGNKPVIVAPLTETELVITSSSGNGIWLNILEKAYGTIRNLALPEDKKDESVTDLIARGGSSRPVIKALTGHNTQRFSLAPKDKNKGLTAMEIEQKLPKLRSCIKSALAEKRLICCSTPKTVATKGISPTHAYAIIGYDSKSDAVEIWNPHGNNFKPKGDPSLELGYPTKAGKFSIPLKDFVKVFNGVAYELSA